jgi:cyanophycin synthetase
MGEPGDLLLVFADALVRSWKQITKFKPASAALSASSAATGQVGRGPGEGLAPMPNSSPQPTPVAVVDGAERPSALNLDGLIRDERGIRYAPETED